MMYFHQDLSGFYAPKDCPKCGKTVYYGTGWNMETGGKLEAITGYHHRGTMSPACAVRTIRQILEDAE